MATILCKLTQFLNNVGDWLALLPLRLALAYTFWNAGVSKLNGENWFANIDDKFPFPFNILPVELSWFLATWGEILGALGLLVGLATRFWAATLIIIDIVAWVSVHAGNGYNVCDNGWQLPFLFLVMLIPLVLHGAGKLSLDHYIVKNHCNKLAG